jgi:hypothetical protein
MIQKNFTFLCFYSMVIFSKNIFIFFIYFFYIFGDFFQHGNGELSRYNNFRQEFDKIKYLLDSRYFILFTVY